MTSEGAGFVSLLSRACEAAWRAFIEPGQDALARRGKQASEWRWLWAAGHHAAAVLAAGRSHHCSAPAAPPPMPLHAAATSQLPTPPVPRHRSSLKFQCAPVTAARAGLLHPCAHPSHLQHQLAAAQRGPAAPRASSDAAAMVTTRRQSTAPAAAGAGFFGRHDNVFLYVPNLIGA